MELVDSSVGQCHLLQNGVEEISAHLTLRIQSKQVCCEHLSQSRAGHTGGALLSTGPAFHRSLVAPGYTVLCTYSRENPVPRALQGPNLPMQMCARSLWIPSRGNSATSGSCDFSCAVSNLLSCCSACLGPTLKFQHTCPPRLTLMPSAWHLQGRLSAHPQTRFWLYPSCQDHGEKIRLCPTWPFPCGLSAMGWEQDNCQSCEWQRVTPSPPETQSYKCTRLWWSRPRVSQHWGLF